LINFLPFFFYMATKSPQNPYKGRHETPAGVMNIEMAARHKLAPFTPTDKTYVKRYGYGNRKVKKHFEAVNTYRLMVHGVTQPKLASSLRYATHYLLEPMSRTTGATDGNYQSETASPGQEAVVQS